MLNSTFTPPTSRKPEPVIQYAEVGRIFEGRWQYTPAMHEFAGFLVSVGRRFAAAHPGFAFRHVRVTPTGNLDYVEYRLIYRVDHDYGPSDKYTFATRLSVDMFQDDRLIWNYSAQYEHEILSADPSAAPHYPDAPIDVQTGL